MSTGSKQLLAFAFESDSEFEGQLVGALERIEIGGTMRVLDGLFVAREPAPGELNAIWLRDIPPSRMTSRLLDFRLDARERETATRRALDGAAGQVVRSLGAVLRPGTAIAAVLVEHKRTDTHRSEDALTDAVARLRGIQVASEFVDASRITELTPRLVAAAQHVG